MVEIEQTTGIGEIMETLKDNPIKIAREQFDPELVDKVVDKIREDSSVSPIQIQALIYNDTLAQQSRGNIR